jgi:hypothetical protein
MDPVSTLNGIQVRNLFVAACRVLAAAKLADWEVSDLVERLARWQGEPPFDITLPDATGGVHDSPVCMDPSRRPAFYCHVIKGSFSACEFLLLCFFASL